MQLWINGGFRDQAEAFIPVTDRGFLLGDGFFETMRAHDGKISWLDAHKKRLDHHAEQIGFPVGLLPAAEDIAEIVATLFEQVDGKDAVVRLTVSRGSGARGLLPPADPVPTILITVSSFEPVDPGLGLRLYTSLKVRRNACSVAGGIKSINYLDNIVAKQEAQFYHGDDAIILSSDGNVAETTVANIFGIKDGRLWTPHDGTGILCGLARDFILDWAEGSGREVSYAAKKPDMLKEFDALFTANALQGLRIVDKVDGLVIGTPAMTFFTELAQIIEKSLCESIVI